MALCRIAYAPLQLHRRRGRRVNSLWASTGSLWTPLDASTEWGKRKGQWVNPRPEWPSDAPTHSALAQAPPRPELRHIDLAGAQRAQGLAQRRGSAAERRESAKVGGDDASDVEEPGGVGGLVWPHRVEVADRQDCHTGPVELAD